MDISKYRDNVELSDICVVVENHEFHLHKFPLSINCDYFKTECKNQTKINLNNFPGGKLSFEIIADHCYGKDVELTTENVSGLFLAAEFLGMSGKTNLVEKCKKFIDRIFRSAEYSRNIDSIIELIDSCRSMETDLLKSFIERGFMIIVQIWLRPLSNYKSSIKEKCLEDLAVFEAILNLDSYFIENIIASCSDDESKFPYIAKLVVRYFEINLLNEEKESENWKTGKEKTTRRSGRRESVESCSSIDDYETSHKDEESLSKSKTKIKRDNLSKDENIKDVFDQIVSVLPNEINLGNDVTVNWLQKTLSFCKKYKCKNKNKLLQICGGVLVHASVEELQSMDPKNVTEMIEQTLNNDKVDKNIIKWIWDHHFLEMAQNSELDPVIFRKVVKNMPESQHVDPDVVFKIVLSILNNIDSDGQKYKDELMESVDLEKITPENLEIAVDSGFWSVDAICKIAIKRLKEKENYSQKNYYTKDYKSNFEVNLDKHVHSVGHYSNGNRIASNFRSHSYTNYLNSISCGYEEETPIEPADYSFNHYSTSKYISTNYFPDSYLTLEENLKYELKKISDSYSDYYKKHNRSRSRRRYPIAHHY